MSRYFIHEGNMDRFNTKMNQIQRKCNKYGFNFSCKEVGEEFRVHTNESGIEETIRFIEVEVEGEYKISGWEFIAVIDHTEGGNIVRAYNTDVEIPKRYWTSEPVCEHCSSKHRRTKTYLVMNSETGEFKQVGSSCLKGYTNGLSAEGVALYISYFDEVMKFESVSGTSYKIYDDTKLYLEFVIDCVKYFGYFNSYSEYPTSVRANKYMDAYPGKRFFGVEEVQKDIDKYSISPDSNSELADKIIQWSQEATEKDNEYRLNLKAALGCKYIARNSYGIVASAVPAYNREMNYLQAKAERDAERKASAEASKYVGNVGDKIEVDVVSAKVLTSTETPFGTNTLFEFKDKEGNVYTWWTSTFVNIDSVTKLFGKVKKHSEFRGVKQTELTRCKQLCK